MFTVDAIDAAYQRAWAAFEVGRYDLCRQSALEGLREDPQNVDLIVLLGHVDLICDNYRNARARGANAIEIDPEDPRGYSILAWGTISDVQYSPNDPKFVPQSSDAPQAHEDRIRTARKLVKRCLELDPHQASYFTLLAELEFLSDQPGKALEAAGAGLAVDPSHAGSSHARIRALRHLRRLDDAIETGRTRLSFDPEDAEVHHSLAQLYLEQKDIASATCHARQAVRLKPTDAEHRQTYWDTIKAKNPLFRPFVYWQFFAKRVSGLSEKVSTVALVSVGVVSGGIGAWAQDAYDFAGAPLLAVAVGLVAAIVLASERPCMLLVDLIMFATDQEYRATVDRRELAITTSVAFTALLLVSGFVLAAFSIYLPLGVLFVCLVFVAPVYCLIRSKSVTGKLVFTFNLLVMACLLTCCVELFEDSRPNTAQRIDAIYFFMGFMFAGIVGPALYAHMKQQEQRYSR